MFFHVISEMHFDHLPLYLFFEEGFFIGGAFLFGVVECSRLIKNPCKVTSLYHIFINASWILKNCCRVPSFFHHFLDAYSLQLLTFQRYWGGRDCIINTIIFLTILNRLLFLYISVNLLNLPGTYLVTIY